MSFLIADTAVAALKGRQVSDPEAPCREFAPGLAGNHAALAALEMALRDLPPASEESPSTASSPPPPLLLSLYPGRGRFICPACYRSGENLSLTCTSGEERR